MTRPLVWFRRDLRVDDNTALLAAAARADDGLVALFVVSPAEWRAHDDAPVKVDFWLRNLVALSRELAALHVALLVETADRARDVPSVVRRVVEAHRCTEVHANREYEVDEARRDLAVAKALGVPLHLHDDRLLLAPGSVRTKAGGPYTVFTPFRRTWEALLRESPPKPRAKPKPLHPIAKLHPSKVPSQVEGFASAVDPALWPAGEDAATKRLRRFTRHALADYHAGRDRPALDGTSQLSPYLAAGVISPRRCLAAALGAGRGKGPSTWVSELCWRDFYAHVLVAFPRVSMNRAFRKERESVPWRRAPTELARWCEGTTGYPLVDAAMRQLLALGWMHNRLRMVVAMFLTKDLLLDWREGERHFMRHLVDGDLANNNGGWQWSASTGTDAQPYFRIFNPASQAKRYDPDGAFVRTWVPELEGVPTKRLFDPDAATRKKHGYPAPMVDHAEARARTLRAFRGE